MLTSPRNMQEMHMQITKIYWLFSSGGDDIIVPVGTYVLTDDDGAVLTDDEGYVLLGELT